ncbi:hypothetical protein EJD97_003162 [Solanum chilense]|uniref:glutamine synthetase n=1 Tax=Solanum chilense TaxID=4083 RepID=A0A6N2BZX7_SOLCI|nr:hypothetical protein EJD97_003162 [Solanum chilense]
MSLLDLVNLDLSECHKTNKSRIIAEYIWIDGSGMNLRSKGRTLHGPVTSPSQIPKWNYDGSSTGQAPGEDSEVWYRAGVHFVAEKSELAPWLANWRISWTSGCDTKLFMKFLCPVNVLGPYYCGVGAKKAFGRDIVNSHYKACLYAGVNIGGINAEVMAGQWEFQVGPTVGISPCDDLWVARYILVRIAEAAGVIVSFDPKPVEYQSMRADGGLEVINKAIEKLGKRHKEHIAVYGVGNESRLTGEHETADINTFNFGIADRGASIRIGRETEKAGKGYLEDRRPSSNMDPYMVTFMIAETTILWKP